MKNFAIMRVQKLQRGSRGGGTLGTALKHLEHHEKSAEISHPEHTCNNYYKARTYKEASNYISKNIEEHNKHHERAFRKDAAVACEFIFSYSPTVGQDMRFAHEFETEVFAFLKEQYPRANCLAIARHCDESSFHWHIVMTFYDKDTHTLSIRDNIGGPGDLKRAQDIFADKVKHLGLERGIPKQITKSKHKTKRQHNHDILTQKEKEDRLIEQRAKEALRNIFGEDR